jgi:hypothetical protein
VEIEGEIDVALGGMVHVVERLFGTIITIPHFAHFSFGDPSSLVAVRGDVGRPPEIKSKRNCQSNVRAVEDAAEELMPGTPSVNGDIGKT